MAKKRVAGRPTIRNELNAALASGAINRGTFDSAMSQLRSLSEDGRLTSAERAQLRALYSSGTGGTGGDGGTGGTGGAGGTSGTPPTEPPSGFTWVKDTQGNWQLVQKSTGTTDPVSPTEPPQAVRTSAREFLRDLFVQLGFSEADRTALMRDIDTWIGDGLADVGNEAILAKFRGSTIYANRFKGMAALRARGQAISEAEYVAMERSYRRVLSSYNLPSEFYDNYDDYAKFIEADVSAQELEDRVIAANQIVNSNDSGVMAELSQYYGVDRGTAMSYLLGLTDADGVARMSARSQQELSGQIRAAQIGGAAERFGFSMDRTQSEMLAGTAIGQTLNPFNAATQAQLEGTFAGSRRAADRERTLAGIDSENFQDSDALLAAFGDEEKRLASEQRAKRERARFSGSGGASAASLSVSRNL